MKRKAMFVSLLLMAAFLAAAPGAEASNTWYANGVSGSDSNNCRSAQTACKTIGHAISLASSGDSIIVAAATYHENLTITIGLAIVGSGATTTIIDGGGVNTVVSINNTSNTTPHVGLAGLTIQNGAGYGGGGIRSSGALLVITNTSIRSNSAKPGISGAAAGAGIYNDESTLVINNSTISGNTARGGTVCERLCSGSAQGAGIYNHTYTKQATLTLNNSTVSGNNAISGRLGSSGGAISGSGSVTISNSTISGNSAASTGGISGPATVQNSIVANNSGGNCAGALTSKGYNLSSDDTCKLNGPGDMNNTDPLLGPLQNNGGPTQTMALLPGSLAIDAGNPSGCTDGQGRLLKTDQRGEPRLDKEDTGGCDIGAYELQGD
ncbi:MAG TPA: choice-of-anchor Q domain-containing protein [Terriglobales bacterium]|nr:choice-of-anchor Q domain-containing protein [Terriglobales bacterium]